MKRRPEDIHDENRREIMRRATMYTTGFLVAAVAIALIGAAFVAWLLTWRGLPFVRTWLIATAIILLPGLTAAVWNLIRDR